MSWNRVYRPHTVQQLHLVSIRTQLEQFLEKGQLPQAFLFSGPKGTGKTSTARIIAAIANEPKNQKQLSQIFSRQKVTKQPLVSPDISDQNLKIFSGHSYVVVELDAASNRGIDDIRALKERLSVPPPPGQMMVVILDEAHMLTTEAFNALLKILEEPPEYALFILATTEEHKIPETIKSRCFHLQFTHASTEEISNAVERILKQEKVTYDDDALALIIEYSQGSFRDAIKYAESSTHSGKLTTESVALTIGPDLSNHITTILTSTIEKDEKQVCESFSRLREMNVDQKFFFRKLLELLHTSILSELKVIPGKPQYSKAISLYLLQQLKDIDPVHPIIPLLSVEIILLDIISRAKKKDNPRPKVKAALISEPQVSSPSSEPLKTSKLSSPTQKKVENQNLTPVQPKVTLTKLDSLDESHTPAESVCSRWMEIVKKITEYNATLAALLQSAVPEANSQTAVQINVFYEFHKEQLSQTKFAQELQSCIESLMGQEIDISYAVSTAQQPNSKEHTSSLVDDVSELLM